MACQKNAPFQCSINISIRYSVINNLLSIQNFRNWSKQKSCWIWVQPLDEYQVFLELHFKSLISWHFVFYHNTSQSSYCGSVRSAATLTFASGTGILCVSSTVLYIDLSFTSSLSESFKILSTSLSPPVVIPSNIQNISSFVIPDSIRMYFFVVYFPYLIALYDYLYALIKDVNTTIWIIQKFEDSNVQNKN